MRTYLVQVRLELGGLALVPAFQGQPATRQIKTG